MDFLNTSGLKSPFSPRVKQTGQKTHGISSTKGLSKTSRRDEASGEIIYKTPNYTFETHGPPLPAMVTEALAFASGEISVRISECGWCWLVCGRRVLAWPLDSPAGAPTAKELTLPQTDLMHKADLVVIFRDEVAQLWSCVGVSPEGVVRVWRSLSGSHCESSAQLDGRECLSLHMISPQEMLVATTTCDLIKLQLNLQDGRSSVSCQVVRPSAGWLGGLGRRVSSLFFGALPTPADTRLVGVCVLRGGVPILIGATPEGPVLQLWAHQVQVHALNQVLAPALHTQGNEMGMMELSALDMCESPSGIFVLLAARDSNCAVAEIIISLDGPPRCVCVRWLNRRCERDRSTRIVSLSPQNNSVLVYSESQITIMEWSSERSICESLPEGCLGCGANLVLSSSHGLLRVNRNRNDPLSMCDSPMNSQSVSEVYSGNLALYEIDPEDMVPNAKDAISLLKLAVVLFARGDRLRSERVLSDLTPSVVDISHGPLDDAVLNLFKQMLDDEPLGDPRWQSVSVGSSGLGSSWALQPDGQLRDKRKAIHIAHLAIQPLQSHLNTVYDDWLECNISTVNAISIYCQGLAVVQQLQRAYPRHTQLLDQLFDSSVDSSEYSKFGVSSAELCFSKASQALYLLKKLAESNHPNAALSIVARVLNEMQSCRGFEPAPFPASVAPQLLSAFDKLFHQAVDECVNGDVTPLERGRLTGDLCEAICLLLEDMNISQCDNKLKEVFLNMKQRFIRHIVNIGERESALRLSEKYNQFDILTELCIQREDMEALNSYIDKYGEQGMYEAAFSLIKKSPNRGQLLLAIAPRHRLALSRWLSSSESACEAALTHIGRNDFLSAGRTLTQQAIKEEDSIARLQTMSSISKLCLLASNSDCDELLSEVQKRLDLCEQIIALPSQLKNRYGLNDDQCRVSTPEELIQMYTDSDDVPLNEFDYKKALDLAELIDDMAIRDERRLDVWCACILRDSWSCGGASERDLVLDKMFFKLIDLVQVMGGDLKVVLPHLDDIITSRQLAELASDPQFRYLLKYGCQSIDALAGDN